MDFTRLMFWATVLIATVTPAAFAGDLKPRVDTTWRAGTERSVLMTEAWVPLAQTETIVIYGDIRFMGDDQDSREGNIGIGYRAVSDAAQAVAGVHAWIDRRTTERGSEFYQTAIGAELLGETYDGRLNAYIPLSSPQAHVTANAGNAAPYLAGSGIFYDTDGRVVEEPQGGFDIEAGRKINLFPDHADAIRLYGGGYVFTGQDSPDVKGLRARATADINPAISIGASIQKDAERGSQAFLDLTVRFPFDAKKRPAESGLRARLDESPVRDVDIVTGAVVTDTGLRKPVINNTTGAAQTVLFVDNTAAPGGDGTVERPFDTLTEAQAEAAGHDIVYIARGDGTTLGMDQGLVLNQAGIQVIGEGTPLAFDNAAFSAPRRGDGGGGFDGFVLREAGTAPVISNIQADQDGITITADGVRVTGLSIENADRDGISILSTDSGPGVEGVLLDNLTVSGNRIGVKLRADGAAALSAAVEGVVASGNDQHGIAVHDNTTGDFTVDLGGGSLGSTGFNTLDGNTLEDLAVEYDGGTIAAQNNWWGQPGGPGTRQVYFGAAINDGLVGHWTYDTAWMNATTAFDRSGNGNDGTFGGGLSNATAVAAAKGQGLQLDGINDLVTVLDDPTLQINTNTVTITGWFTPTVDVTAMGAAFPILLMKRPFNVGGYAAHFTRASGLINIQYCFTGACSQRNATAPFTAGNTYFYTGIIDQTQLRMLINNTAQGAPVAIANPIGSSAGTNLLMGSGLFRGTLDDLRVYSRVLGTDEITDLYLMNAASTVDSAGALAAAP